MPKLCCEKCFALIRGRSETARLCLKCAGMRTQKRAISRYQTLAHQFVTIAVRYGDLTNLQENFVACADCGSRAQEYDHRDYMKPLQVDPVCRSCNQARGEALNKFLRPDLASAA